jgi:hypothetical protein
MKAHKPDIGGSGSQESGSLAVDAVRSKRRGNHPGRCRVVKVRGDREVLKEIFDDGVSEDDALPELDEPSDDDEVLSPT